MALVVSVEVAQIYPDAGITDFSPYIQIADTFITDNLQGTSLSTGALKSIELYLSAHFALITQERGGLTRQKVGDSEDFYQLWTSTKVGLMATRFGQQAVMLDTTGTLARLGTGKLKAQFRVLPQPASTLQVTTYNPDANPEG